jgi:sulfur dioxygenase
MYFRQLIDPDTGSMTYLIGDLEQLLAVVIDPHPRQDQLILSLLAERDLKLLYVLRTHVHASQIDSCHDLLRLTGATLVLGDAAPCVGDCLRLKHGDLLRFYHETIAVLGTPGHTPACVSFLWRDRLFCGDVLEIGACGRAEDGDADLGRMFDSVTQRIFILPDETLIFPGHDFNGRTVSTVTEERQRNPCFSGHSRDVCIAESRDRTTAKGRHQPKFFRN